jgi:hypothetical protein
VEFDLEVFRQRLQHAISGRKTPVPCHDATHLAVPTADAAGSYGKGKPYVAPLRELPDEVDGNERLRWLTFWCRSINNAEALAGASSGARDP